MVRAVVPTGKKAGVYVGRVAIRATGRFDLKTENSKQSISYRHCNLLQRADGYSYEQGGTALPPAPIEWGGFPRLKY